jgi:GNAT superfamily N-acetyltransferase
MTQTLKIRAATPGDAAALAELSGELGYPTTADQMQKRLDAVLADSKQRIFIAEEDTVVGWLQVSLVWSLESGVAAEIRGLVVAESFRGGGIGGKLVAAAEVWAVKNGCTRIRVRTNVVRKKAHQFYTQLGYRVTKKQEVFDKELTPASETNSQ